MRGTILAIGFGIVVVGAAPAAAPTASDRILKTFTDCRAITQPEARLACFEKSTDALEAQVRDRNVRVVDRQDVRQARRSLFGFTLPKIDLFGGGRDRRDPADDEDAFTEINTTVASSNPGPNGRVEIRLADETGAVWQTTEPVTWPPKPGAKVRIKQASLGGYFLSTEGKTYRAMRIR